jgi:hypothetical protein
MIGAEQIAATRGGAALINASRGTVVDIDALVAALDSAKLDELKRIDGTLRARILSRWRSMMGR